MSVGIALDNGPEEEGVRTCHRLRIWLSVFAGCECRRDGRGYERPLCRLRSSRVRFQKDARRENWIERAMSKKTQKQEGPKTKCKELFSFFPPLPLARELKAGLAIRNESRRLRTSPVSWLGGRSSSGETGASTQPSRGAAPFRAIRRSGLRACFSRLTVARRRRLTRVDPNWSGVNAPSSRARSPR